MPAGTPAPAFGDPGAARAHSPEPPRRTTGWTTPPPVGADGRGDDLEWPSLPTEPEYPFPYAPPGHDAPPPEPRPVRHSRNPVDRLTRGLPDSWRVTIDWVVTIVGAIAIVLLVKAFVVNPYRIPSSSMEPTLHCARPATGLRGALLRPGAREPLPLPPARSTPRRDHRLQDAARRQRSSAAPGGTFVKRLIGLPGDTVELRLLRGNGYVYINGKRAEGAVHPEGPARRRPELRPGQGAAGKLLHDGRQPDASCDSRMWGTVPRANLIGKVFATYWPPNRISLH